MDIHLKKINIHIKNHFWLKMINMLHISDGFLENFGEKHEKGLKVISDQ